MNKPVSAIDIAEDRSPTLRNKISFEVPGVLPEWLQSVNAKVTSDGKWLFVELGPANRIAVINAETDDVVDNIIVGKRAWQLAFMPDERFLITTIGNSNDVTIIDVRSQKALISVQIGQQPWGVVVIPDTDGCPAAEKE